MSSTDTKPSNPAAHKKRWKPTYLNAIEGPELYNYMGNRVVLSHTTHGNAVAVKHKPSGAFVRSEAQMMHFASTHGILAPKVLGCYDVEPEVVATVTDVVPGQSLDKVWHDLTEAEREGVKRDLKEQVRLFRTITQPFIGRVHNQETFNFFDRLHFRFMGPFGSEEDFDEFCLGRVKRKSGAAYALWKRLLPGMRGRSSGRFVLTHGDLAARNIMVHEGRLSGIVDWEYSGFFPEYMEYACNFVVHDQHERWWLPVLKEVLNDAGASCGFKRARFVGAVKDRGW
ncbi:uncharacterized protein DSM5745_03903 [Aspergillus mulundensis]|uniref:Aminoglycoside phosphotransferase domain-containing protein n=1 Tax=Aspergillus mulundensis TaxID=1810919 RepID=A0A3D8SB35_9EURO|nr:Uncharacterized protein DSM5745_03903 [Aspergillus mulundensis]RDW83577.1 Uncharacterized protein DSM5745_03903 [Aspergillus mulundensis]